MSTVEKLVRDKIPEIMASRGEKVVVRKVSGAELVRMLKLKLLEEVFEYLESDQVEELADVVEVVLELARTHGLSQEELEKIRLEKRDKRGGFSKGLVVSFSHAP